VLLNFLRSTTSNRVSTETTSAGVAFHHAGMDLVDRRAVEEGFLHGNVNIICSTSTLAVGVNMPCHLVIIKGTVGWSENGVHQYADLEIMQMLGRAGRPQFESSACAVILTRDDKIKYYQNMVSGKELLESSLHLNLIDHLNAEIGLGTISNIHSAKQWLGGTFLFVRLTKNPNHYKLKEKDDAECWKDNELLEQICNRDLRLLQDVNLISGEGKLKCTEFGDAMARYCIKFETMKVILSLPPKAKMSEIVSSFFFIICP
jgi:ATP-dependent DNA helicase HFM1/MER3